MNEARSQPPPLLGAIDNKCLLADDLQLAPWTPQYRAAIPPKYFGNSYPCKFLMRYEAAIASSGGDETTLAKSFIISLEGVAANWYATLKPWSIQSWHHHREKFQVNFHGFQADLSTEEDFLSCAQYEKEALSDFCRRFLRLKAQALEVWPGYHTSHKGIARRTVTQPFHQTASKNIPRIVWEFWKIQQVGGIALSKARATEKVFEREWSLKTS
jgi:hypothetical protein